MYLLLNDKRASSEFLDKTKRNQSLVDQAAYAISKFGVPVEGLTFRRLEKMALAFLAVAQIDPKKGWRSVKDLNDKVAMKTRDIINYVNSNFQEKISLGSYDDIRRKDLKFLVLADVIVRTNPSAAMNDSTRGYALNPIYREVVKNIGSADWDSELKKFMADKSSLSKILTPLRQIKTIPIKLPSGKKLEFSPGEHNVLQKAIIEDFLPRYGFGSEVLYVGDTADKFLFLNKRKLEKLKFFELSHAELPDVVAYSQTKNWLYLIEAVHSSGPVSNTRLMELKKLTEKCKADIVYVTAFLNRETFRKFVKDVAWETEVWIADAPDHLIHFNGNKFLGPYAR
jgi:type II restriction enzyme